MRETLSAIQALARFQVSSGSVLPDPQAASSGTDERRTPKILARKSSATRQNA